MNGPGVRVAALLVAALAAGCDYARMTNDEAVQTYEAPLPTMPAGTVPIGGGIEAAKRLPPTALRSPLPASAATVERGRAAYGNYCVPCHGPRADGNGTVGQSFAPLPTDLRSAPVQGQSDGALFATISLGFRRHPPLADTVSETDRWAVVAYLRALPLRPSR
ncbi:MAG: cytochrome c [Deltaproteobacteria bacterium]|nr:cytochrome c [Deltaproteobacteria bacterium]